MKTQFVPASVQNSGSASVNGYLGAVSEINSYAVGTLTGSAYTLTTSLAPVLGGSTSPVIVIPTLNQYHISVTVLVNLIGSTFAANQNLTLNLHNTTQSATALTGITIGLPIVTTATQTVGVYTFDGLYTPVAALDSLTIYASVAALPSAGSIVISNATITATVLPA